MLTMLIADNFSQLVDSLVFFESCCFQSHPYEIIARS